MASPNASDTDSMAFDPDDTIKNEEEDDEFTESKTIITLAAAVRKVESKLIAL